MPLEYALQHKGRFPDPGPWKLPQASEVVLSAPLGIEALPKQTCDRARRKPFVLNVMVVGETGLGKTTFLNTLFNTDLTEEITPKAPQDTKTVEITPRLFELSEDGVTLSLTVVDTPGFGDQLNREDNLRPIVSYIDEQFHAYLQAERSPDYRRAIPDTRIHTLLYFRPPTGHALKELDILALRTLAAKVNVIPVIARADSLTAEEKASFKTSILHDLRAHHVPFYPSNISEEPEHFADLEPHFPFTVIGSDRIVTVGGKASRGRSYRWGVVAVDDEEHCDFVHLRRMIMDTCLADLLETTHTHHYAAYRALQLRSNGRRESILACDDAYEVRVEATKQSLADEMFRKEEEMRLGFVSRVREKESSLREREEALVAQREQMMRELEEERRQLEMEEREVDTLLGNRNLLAGGKKMFGKK